MNLDEIKQRLEERAKDAAGDGETVLVEVGAAQGLPAWSARVEWITPDGRSEWTGCTGPLDGLESQVTVLIAARKKPTRADT